MTAPPMGDTGENGGGGGRAARRVVVTGAAGFIGSHLTERLLLAGCQVTGVDNFDPWYSPDRKRANLVVAARHRRFTLVTADLADADLGPLFDGVDTVFHLAGRPGVQDSWGDGFAAAARLNIELTHRVLHAATEVGVRRLVYGSSSSVYGDSASGGARTVDPISPYGVSKAAGEQLAAVHRRLGLDVICLRYFTVYGPRQRPDMAIHRLLASAAGPDSTPFWCRGSGAQARQFTYVGDVVAATVAAGLRRRPEPLAGSAAGIFDVGGGSSTTLNQLIAEVERIAGRAPAIRREAAAAGDPEITRADIEPLRRLLGWRPVVGLTEGLDRQWRWQRAAGPRPRAQAREASLRVRS